MLDDNLIAAFKQRQLDIDCAEITLTQEGVDNPVEYKGRGYIRQNQSDALAFKIYSESIQNARMLQNFGDFLNIQAGQIFPASSFYTLSAIAADGKVWKASRILPSVNSSPLGTIITGNVFELSTESPSINSEKIICLHYFDSVRVPCLKTSKTTIGDVTTVSLDTSVFRTADSNFKVRKREDELVVSIRTKNPKFESLPLRVTEALSFISGQTLFVRARLLNTGEVRRLVLSSKRRKSDNTQLEPPLAENTIAFRDYGWKLFCRYLKYVLREDSGDGWNYCTYHMHNARESSANSVDAWAVGLSVAVEGLSSLLLAKRDRRKERKFAAFLRRVMAEARSVPTEQKFSDQLAGSFGMMTDVSARKKLLALAQARHSEARNVYAWTALRNKHVHPKKIDVARATTGNYQEVYDKINKVTVLMYQIVFHLIGYKGMYTDYGTANWPTVNFPLESNSAEEKRASLASKD